MYLAHFYNCESVSRIRMTDKSVNLSHLEPSEAAMSSPLAAEKLAVQVAGQSRVFSLPLPEGLSKCLCGECKDVGGERPQYCCASLHVFSSSLTSHGRSLLSSFSELTDPKWEGCLAAHPKFIEKFLNDDV